MESHTVGAITLGPSNMNVGYKFFSLMKGKILVRQKWTELPVSNEVIHKLGEFSHDLNDDYDVLMDEDESEHEENTGDNDNIPILEEFDLENNESLDSANIETAIEENLNAEVVEEKETEEDNLTNKDVEDGINNENEEEEKIERLGSSEITEEKENQDSGERRYNLRPNRELSYSHKYSFLSIHGRVNRWGERAKEAVREELRMFEKEKVFEKVKNPT